MTYLLLPVVLFSSACGLGAGSCPAIDCLDLLELEIGPAEGALEEVVYEVTVEVDGDTLVARCEPETGRWECTDDVPPDSRLEIFDVWVEDDSSLRLDVTGGFRPIGPTEIVVTVMRDGAVVHDEVFEADFEGDSDSDCASCISHQERIDL